MSTSVLAPWPSTWSAAPDCPSNLASLKGGNIWLAPAAASSCYPPGDIYASYYAPAPSQCPQGWSHAGNDNFIDADPLTWTLYDCCSSGYTWTTSYRSSTNNVCASYFTTKMVIPVWDHVGQSGSLAPLPSKYTTVSSRTAFAQPIHAVHFPKDSATTATEGSGLAAVTPAPTSPATPLAMNGGLSAGAKAGISLGVTVVALSIIAAAVWILFSKRRRRRAEFENLEKAKVELDSSMDSNRALELSRPFTELPVPNPPPVELEGGLPVVELEAAPVPRPAPSHGGKFR